MSEANIKLQNSIEKLKNKDFGIYFFTLDSKGNALAGIANIYEHVKILNELGYNAYILHEKNDYTDVSSWLGEEYSNLPHVSIESQELNIGPHDFVIIPEVFSNVMEQTKAFPSKRIVLSQSYDYILELLMIGTKWADYGINDVITTTNNQKEYIESLFGNLNVDIIPPAISDYFVPSEKPKKPIIAIHTRDQRDTLKIIKTFYLKYPQYKWVTFRDMRGMPKKTFSSILSECCLSVWVDDISSFGTYPLESINCDTPVIAKIPDMRTEWMEEDDKLTESILWTDSNLKIPELISSYMNLWLEDSVPEELYDKMSNLKGKYTIEDLKKNVSIVYSKIVDNRIIELKAKEEELEKAE